MQATARTVSITGLEAHPIRVEVDSGRGPTCFHLVGLPEASVREARVRVRAALCKLGTDLGEYVITINLAPADLRKSGGAYDVAIALACLGALGRVPAEALSGVVLLGELSLSGAVRPVRGVLPALTGAVAHGLRRAIVPTDNGIEAAQVPGMEVWVADDLESIVDHMKGGQTLSRPELEAAPTPARSDVDWSEVRGQHAAKRALEVAAAGGHNVIMVGPPGSGKTMLARRLPTVLPPLSRDEALETTAIHSVAGLLPRDAGLVRERPFRAPHHTVSAVGLVGGGSPIRPGEVSLAHHGCLFLDELLEFRRPALEALRQPLEDGLVSICRANWRALLPARPLIIAAVNPCPCGYLGDPHDRCTCSPDRVRTYRSRLSGPMMDRIDVQLALPPVDLADLSSVGPAGESSSSVRERVCTARARQWDRRARGEVLARNNATLSPGDLERIGRPDDDGLALLASAVEQLGFSARAYGKVLRVGRTLADLDGVDAVGSAHIAEAIGLRLLDRGRDGEPPLAA